MCACSAVLGFAAILFMLARFLASPEAMGRDSPELILGAADIEDGDEGVRQPLLQERH